jgi:histidine triad (HIT) family protein
MTTLFEKIINREIPGIFVYEDDVCVVLMDKFPTTVGQCLVMPREAIDYAFDLSDETYLHCMRIAKQVVTAIDVALQPERTCLVIEGFEVPHAHIKLFPCYEKILLTDRGIETSDEELETMAQLIRAHL